MADLKDIATDFRINNFTALSGTRSVIHTHSSPRPCETDYLKICKTIPRPENDAGVTEWLASRMSSDHPFLLAHADDGVIWGKWIDGQLRTSHDIKPEISPQLRGITLQQAFVFGLESEIRLFRDESGSWRACEIKNPDSNEDVIIESHILWGNEIVEDTEDQEFTHVRDKTCQSMDHILPIKINKDQVDEKSGNLPRLMVCHFIEYDKDTGEARIGLSRLVKVGIWPDTEEKDILP